MSRLIEIQEELQATGTALNRLEQAVATGPTTPAIIASARPLRRRQEVLEKNFLDATNEEGLDVCTYRTFMEDGNPSLRAVFAALGSFQDLVTVVYDAVKYNRPRMAGDEASKKAKDETTFGIGYMYPGSLGIALTLPNKRLLTGTTELDRTITHVFDLARVDNAKEISDYANEFGSLAITKVHRWARDHAVNHLNVDIEWRRQVSIARQLKAPQHRFLDLYDMLRQTGEDTSEVLHVSGIMQGADAAKMRFHFVTDAGDEMEGRSVVSLTENQTVTLLKPYRVAIRRDASLKYATGEQKVKYTLIEIDSEL